MFNSVKQTRQFQWYLKVISWLRDKLRWEVSGGVVAIIGGIVGGTLTAVSDFLGAEVCFVVSGIFAALWLLSLNFSILLRLCGVMGAAALTWFLVDRINIFSNQTYAAENPTALVPDDLPSPQNICPGPQSITLFLGSDGFGSSAFPFIAVQVGDVPIVTIDRGANNTIFVSADIRSADGYLLSRITDNKVLVLPQHATLTPRINLHDLSVLDEYGNVVLDINYMNKNTIRITGILNSGGHTVTITPDAISVDNQGGGISSSLFCDAHVGLEIR